MRLHFRQAHDFPTISPQIPQSAMTLIRSTYLYSLFPFTKTSNQWTTKESNLNEEPSRPYKKSVQHTPHTL